MGVVYEAQDLRLGRLVALKFLPEELVRDHAAACNANYIGRISPRPILAINELHDMDHMKEPREVIWAATGHQSALDDELRARMLQWLQKTVK